MRRRVRNFISRGTTFNSWRSEDRVDAGRARRQQAALERRELDEARRIQRKLLPAVMPPLEGWEVAVSWQPASGVGGDCFDAISFGPARIGLSIADVVGKGIPAALLMSNLQAAVRAFASDTTSPAELCQQVNRILCCRIAEGRFISFFYCIVDSDDGTLNFANAGHYPPILIRADGPAERHEPGGAVLGVFPEGATRRRVVLRAGDRNRPLHRRHH
jgi:sigma-B regulation protein RsbU (phosphoserine phosphatase)